MLHSTPDLLLLFGSGCLLLGLAWLARNAGRLPRRARQLPEPRDG